MTTPIFVQEYTPGADNARTIAERFRSQIDA